MTVTGALMIFSRFTARVVLAADSVTVRALVGGAAMSRQDVLGVRNYPHGKGPRLIELVSRDPAAAPLRLRNIDGKDQNVGRRSFHKFIKAVRFSVTFLTDQNRYAVGIGRKQRSAERIVLCDSP